jgi:hypothetical protein
VELEESRALLEKNGVKIAAVSYDSQEILAAFARKYSIGYPLLSDKNSEVIRRFGIFNHNMAPELRSYGVPHPVEYLISADGLVVKKYFVPNYQHRVAASTVALQEFNTFSSDAPKVTLETGAVRFEIGFPARHAFAGQEVGFFARIAVQPGWHVYGSPLPPGYTPLSIAFESPAIVQQNVSLPEPRAIQFPLLNETLPVYTDAFETRGTLLLKFPLPDGDLILPGQVRFQQCSEDICEPPQYVPFELGLILDPFIISDQDTRLRKAEAKG